MGNMFIQSKPYIIPALFWVNDILRSHIFYSFYEFIFIYVEKGFKLNLQNYAYNQSIGVFIKV